jgi:hypothetical protein
VDRVPGRVPQRGGNEGDGIDVRPRRRKALRHDFQGQDRFQDSQRRQNWNDYKLRQDRFRYSSRGDYYDGDFDSDTVYSDRRISRWEDCEFDEDYVWILIIHDGSNVHSHHHDGFQGNNMERQR